MKITLDLAINHTFDQHAWFQSSKSGRQSEKRDWNIWKPAVYDHRGRGHPPNNWRAIFGGGSVWEWDEQSQEYYLHLFSLEKGVDGFIIDTVNMYSKPSSYPSVAPTDSGAVAQPAHTLCCNGPKIHEYRREIGSMLKKYDTVPRNFALPQFKNAVRSTRDLIKGTDVWTTTFLENHD
ncbi:alpha-glucosidase [Zalerion maritima]|uniref:Alpha-glucosidase n=1 Tax=Zalerion maritima TaxID=339359 RepID=A0AAD5RVB0_9PEZI|nr:alpha-glucosidase [Zalerion maritima]